MATHAVGRLLGLTTFLAFGSPGAIASVREPITAATSDCTLFQPGADRLAAGDCIRCHGMTQTHPVDLDYPAAVARRPMSFRTLEEVTRRGVFLPDGLVKCVTCHDPASPWKYKMALPPGTQARPGVDLKRPETFERNVSRLGPVAPLPPNSVVTPTPLCTSCHTIGD